ncbi:endonuclease toxin domain-containing protein [Neisseria meningitidis]
MAIPAQTNKEQRLQLQRVVEYGKNLNITVKITEIK